MQQDTAARPVGAPVPPTFDTLDLMVDGFLARFTSPATRSAYAGDLALWRSWCASGGLDPLTVQRAHLELFARWLETERGNSAATVHRRLVSLRSFYRVLAADGMILSSPAESVRLPKVVRDRTKYTHLTRGELSSMLRAADEASPTDGALLALMGVLGLRVSEACSLEVDCADRFERGHRMLTVTGKGGGTTGIPVPVQVGRRLDRARGDRQCGPLLVRRDGTRMTRRSAARVVARIAAAAGVDKSVSPHDLRAAAITCALDSGIPLRDVQTMARHADPRTTEIYDRSRGDIDRHGAYILASYLAA
ncbi:tyrosine-type recombinase/integrase [Dietzia sp. ANT_WB102]|uniref:tyrosine-type recombinase/integrase n=1 Tax=Dietzia sp. ANT_WB102 TaxID=2597345 RepID=UPI0011ECFF06|nr:tyrosine-type recombinase/integrase [Dietzia sp. ANT_WB102]KAA0916470.1 tyrosine-type recombinase/integrase [Dietzia sp. ANT_WB102]